MVLLPWLVWLCLDAGGGHRAHERQFLQHRQGRPNPWSMPSNHYPHTLQPPTGRSSIMASLTGGSKKARSAWSDAQHPSLTTGGVHDRASSAAAWSSRTSARPSPSCCRPARSPSGGRYVTTPLSLHYRLDKGLVACCSAKYLAYCSAKSLPLLARSPALRPHPPLARC